MFTNRFVLKFMAVCRTLILPISALLILFPVEPQRILHGRVQDGLQVRLIYEEQFSSSILVMDWHPNTNLLAISEENYNTPPSFVIADVIDKSAKVFTTEESINDVVTSLEFSPDGNFILAVDRYTPIVIWDLAGNPPLRMTYDLPAMDSGNATWASDSTTVAVYGQFRDLQTFTPFIMFDALSGDSVYDDFSTAFIESTTEIYEENPAYIKHLKWNPIEPVLGIGWSRNREGARFTIDIWDMQLVLHLVSQPDLEQPIYYFEWNRGGTQLALIKCPRLFDPCMIVVWDLILGEVSEPFGPIGNVHPFSVGKTIDWNPNSTLLAVADNNSVTVWDVDRKIMIATLNETTAQVNVVVWNHDGSKIAVGSEDGMVRVWDVSLILGTID